MPETQKAAKDLTKQDLKELIKEQAIRELESLRDDFQTAAAAAKNDKSLWPKRYDKSVRGYSLEKSAEHAQELIDRINGASKEGYPPVISLVEILSFEAYSAASHAKKRFSRFKHDDNKNAAQYKKFDERVKRIVPLVTQALYQ